MGLASALCAAHILEGRVMHARLHPARNVFRYGIYYIAVSLSKLSSCEITQERFDLNAFYARDHGPCDGSSLLQWAKTVLKNFDLLEADGEVVLVCMPRVLGYVFNPVSFWLCYDRAHAVRAIICEVHNTFGERHSYLCARPDKGPITHEDVITAKKFFHVSPFLEREGRYEFRFDLRDDRFGVWIDYYDRNQEKTLLTSLTGGLTPLTRAALFRVFWRYPLVTIKAIALIHWQALKIIFKGISYVPKPRQKEQTISACDNIKEI
jgi:DUF1365 family protein